MQLLVAGIQSYSFNDDNGKHVEGRKLHFLVEGQEDYVGLGTKAKGILKDTKIPTITNWPCLCDVEFDFNGRAVSIVPKVK